MDNTEHLGSGYNKSDISITTPLDLVLDLLEAFSMPRPDQQLRAKRKELEMSQMDLARLLGVNRATIGTWEAGTHVPQACFAALIEAFIRGGKRAVRREFQSRGGARG